MKTIKIEMDVKKAILLADTLEQTAGKLFDADTCLADKLVDFRADLADQIDSWFDAASKAEYWRERFDQEQKRNEKLGEGYYKEPYDKMVAAIMKLADKEDNVQEVFWGLTSRERLLVTVNQKIPAIKSIRQRTGMGLKEAKDVVDVAALKLV